MPLIQASFYSNFCEEATEIVEALTLEQQIGHKIQVEASALIYNNRTSNQTLIKYSIGGTSTWEITFQTQTVIYYLSGPWVFKKFNFSTVTLI